MKQDLIYHYANYLNAFDMDYVKYLIMEIHGLGLIVNKAGQINYAPDFKPLPLHYELLFIRHGETFGNCGQSTSNAQIDQKLVANDIKNADLRVFQGNVDIPINQLTQTGQQQAIHVAEKLKKIIALNWKPHVIFHSPLTRAKATALPFVEDNNFTDRFIPLDEIREMSFGSWDNRRVCDLHKNDSCHDFYLKQNALVKKSGINGNQEFQHGESFLEVIIRARKILLHLNGSFHNKKIMMFSHSMFGSACMILLGRGLMHDSNTHIAFDGKRKNNTSYCMPNAQPIALNFELP